MTAAIWWLEWRQALRRPRVMAFSVLVPLLLVSAVALGRAPAPHAALVYTVLFAFFGTFGSAVPWARDVERGLIHRLMLTGVGAPWAVAQRWASSTLLDLIQLLPAMGLIALVYGAGAGVAASLVAGVALGLMAANALGILVASLARSIAETALLASVTALLLLHAAGVFRRPEPEGFAAALERAVPFHYMHVAIGAAVGWR